MSEEKMQLFELFCQNISIQTINKRALVDGIQWELSFNGMKAYMTIYNNGNALAQGNESVLLHVLRIWTGSAQASQELSPGIVPDLNMGWKDWKEDCAALLNYHATHGIPQEEQATDNYKCTRERMFHDFMFRTASNRKKIHWNKVWFVVESWMKRYCFMNMNTRTLMQDLHSRVIGQYTSYLEGDYVPFDIVTSEITYVMATHCAWKLIGEEKHCGRCPLPGRDFCDCLIDLIDDMYVYCENQSVIAYTASNLKRLLTRKTDEVSWHSLQLNSPIEQRMADGLVQAGLLSIPQFQTCAPVHKYRVDFVIKTNSGWSIAIECDGLEYHANRNQYTRDRQRDRILQEHGFLVMRFSSVEIFKNLSGCIEDINRIFWDMQKGKMSYQAYRPLGYFGHS